MSLRRRMFLSPLPLIIAVGFAACGGAEPPPPLPPPPPPPAAPPPAPMAPPAAVAPAPALPEVGFGPTTASEAPKKMPKVSILAPRAEQAIPEAKAKDFQVKVAVKDWEIHENGPHIHLILDNHPYKPLYDVKTPVTLSELLGPADTLSEGEHVLVAFPSRMNHESVKGQGAIAVTHFWVGKKGKSTFKPKDPTLYFSRPKGTYNGSKADHVLVDWYLVNAELGDGKMSLKTTVKGPGLGENGRELIIKEWRPYVLENLRDGEYTISMELDDKDGKPVPGPTNSVTRTIVINREAPDETAAPAPAAEGHTKGEHHMGEAAEGHTKGEHPKGEAAEGHKTGEHKKGEAAEGHKTGEHKKGEAAEGHKTGEPAKGEAAKEKKGESKPKAEKK